MLNLLSTDESRRLRAYFEESGYAEPTLKKHLGAAELPSRHLRNQARLLDRTSAPTTLNVLLRWFWLGLSQSRNLAEDLVPGDVLSLMLQAGLLKADGDQLLPRAMLLHFDGFLIASDHASAIDRKQVEMVLWPNPTSKFLARFAVRRQPAADIAEGNRGDANRGGDQHPRADPARG